MVGSRRRAAAYFPLLLLTACTSTNSSPASESYKSRSVFDDGVSRISDARVSRTGTETTIQPSEYMRLRASIRSCGLTVDPRFSHYVPGSDKVVIFLPEVHTVSWSVQRDRIAKLQEAIGLEAVGFEGGYGSIAQDSVRPIRERTVQASTNSLLKKRSEVLLDAYSYLLRNGSSVEPAPVVRIFDAIRTQVSLSDRLYDFRNSRSIVEQASDVRRFGIDVFGLEESRTALSSRLYTGAHLSRCIVGDLATLRSKLDDAQTQSNNAAPIDKIDELIETVICTAAAFEQPIEDRGERFSQELFRHYVCDVRSRTWASVVGSSEYRLIGTVGGVDHALSYVRSLQQNKASVITLSCVE